MDSVVHFEVGARSMKRAQNFYSKVFGWKLQEMPEMKYCVVHTTQTDKKGMPKKPGAINGGIMKKDKTSQSPVLVINVASLTDALKRIKKAGGKVVMPKMKVADMGLYARVKDTEGNVIGVWQNV